MLNAKPFAPLVAQRAHMARVRMLSTLLTLACVACWFASFALAVYADATHASGVPCIMSTVLAFLLTLGRVNH